MKDLNADQLRILLSRIGACSEARGWAKGKSLAEVWSTCKRGDWMLWLVGKMADKSDWPTRKEVVLASCKVARTSLKYVKKGEKCPLFAILAAEKWAKGKTTLEEVRAAAAADAYAAAAADADDAADDAAADAYAYAAAYAAAAAADAADDAAAACAAYAAACAADAYAAACAAERNFKRNWIHLRLASKARCRSKSLNRSANLCRKLFTVEGK
jgi:hypothetical protein